MAESLLVRIPDTGVDHAEWAVLDDHGLIDGEVVQSTLGDAARQSGGRRVTVIVSGEDVILTSAELPTSSVVQARRAVPFTLEENLAVDVDELHFALGKPDADNRFPVAVISRDRMDALKQQCEDAGLHPASVVPEPLAIPMVEDDEFNPWCAILANGRTILRQNEYGGFSVDTANFSPILDRALREAQEEAPKKLNLYNVGNTPRPSLTIATASANCNSLLEVFARGVGSPNIDLLQGEYSRRQQVGKLLKPWKMTAVLLLLLVVAWGGSTVVEYQRLGNQSVQLDGQIASILKQTFPDIRNPDRSPRAQMKQRLKELGKSSGGFISAISLISKAASQEKDVALRTINFREGRLDIEIEAARLDQFDAFKKRIDASGRYIATIQSANKDGNRVRGRVRVQGK